jgi:hypothetical protein
MAPAEAFRKLTEILIHSKGSYWVKRNDCDWEGEEFQARDKILIGRLKRDRDPKSQRNGRQNKYRDTREK